MLQYQQCINRTNQEASNLAAQAGFPLPAPAIFLSHYDFTFNGVSVLRHQDYTFGTKMIGINNFGNLNDGCAFGKTFDLDDGKTAVFTLKSLGPYCDVKTAAIAGLLGLYNYADGIKGTVSDKFDINSFQFDCCVGFVNGGCAFCTSRI